MTYKNPMPAIKLIHKVCAGYFNNGKPKDQKGYKLPEHQVDIQLWIDDNDDFDNPSWKSVVTLVQNRLIVNRAKKWLKEQKINQQFHDNLVEYSKKLSNDCFIGCFHGLPSPSGPIFHDNQFIIAWTDNKKITYAALFENGLRLELINWSSNNTSGEPLRGNLASQCRCNLLDPDDSWNTK